MKTSPHVADMNRRRALRGLTLAPLSTLLLPLLVPGLARASGGATLSAAQARADLALLRRAFDTLHPGLYRRATPADIDAPFAAADLAVALAVASAWREVAVPPDLVAVGEVGLGGELRPTTRYDLRAAEARRLGFQRLVGPGPGQGRGRLVVTSVAAAVEGVFG
jgi:DNA repair protein RadA/Sms